MSSGPVDRLSELHDSLIYHIFWLLPMRDVVRTSILAKRWHNLWTTTPYLNFDGHDIGGSLGSVRNFVNRVLIFWRGVKILKFKIDFRFEPNRLLDSDFDVWLRFAKEHEVEELYVHMLSIKDLINGGHDYFLDAYWLKEYIYSCSSLKVLSLKGCNLDLAMNVHWNRLKSLTIDCYHLHEVEISKVLCGSPQLEVFILTLRDMGEDLSIRSSSLKKLSIKKFYWYDDTELVTYTDLTIWSPNLEILEMWEGPYSKCVLLNVSSLTHATLCFNGTNLSTYGGFIEENLRQILPTIQHVKLSDCCIKVLIDMKKKDLVSSFPNVKALHFNLFLQEYKEIVCLLEIFPKLERLVLQDEMEIPYQLIPKSSKSDAESDLEFRTNLPKLFQLQLRTIEVTWSGGDNSIFLFLELLLEHANKLEKLVFRMKRTTPSVPSFFLVWASKKLQRIPKSSPTAELIFH